MKDAKKITWIIGLSTAGVALLVWACMLGNTLTPSGQSSLPETVATWQQLAPECVNELVPLAQECNEGDRLPVCTEEDDAIDAEPGPACFWQDPDTGDLWYNDGDGQIPGQ